MMDQQRDTPDPVIDAAIPWGSMIIAISAITGVGIGMSLSLPLLGIILESRGISGTWIGINTATAGIAAIAIAPYCQPLARRFGTTRTLAASILVSAVTLIGFYIFEAFWMWFPLRLIFHSAITVAFVLSEYWINAKAPNARRGFVMGVYGTVLSLGFAVGPLLVMITGPAGPLPFVVGASVLAFSAVPVLLARSRPPPLDHTPSLAFRGFLFAAPMATLAALIFGAVESGAIALLPVYGVRIGHMAETTMLLVAATALGNVVLQVPLGFLSDRMDRRHLLLICAAVSFAGAATLPLLATNLVLAVLLLFVWGGFVAGFYTVGLTHLGSRFRGADLASANAAFVMMYSVGSVIGPAAIGTGLDLWPPHGFAATMAIFFAIYAAVSVVRIVQDRQ